MTTNGEMITNGEMTTNGGISNPRGNPRGGGDYLYNWNMEMGDFQARVDIWVKRILSLENELEASQAKSFEMQAESIQDRLDQELKQFQYFLENNPNAAEYLKTQFPDFIEKYPGVISFLSGQAKGETGTETIQ